MNKNEVHSKSIVGKFCEKTGHSIGNQCVEFTIWTCIGDIGLFYYIVYAIDI